MAYLTNCTAHGGSLHRLIRAAVWAALLVGLAAGLGSGRRADPVDAQQANDAFVDAVIASMTPDERVGQLVMVSFVGDDVSPDSDVAHLIRDLRVGAVLVTASNGNIINRDDTAGQIAGLTNGLQRRAYEANRRPDGGSEYFVPLLIATDNEGDLFPFTNVTHGYTQVPNNMTIGATWSKSHAEAAGEVAGRELSAVGINMLLGPVVDVLDNPRSGGNGDIGIRSFGGNATWAGELGRAYVRGVHAGAGGRMLTVAKHFPGHGGSDRSTDNEVPTVNKSLDQLRRLELEPFAEVAREDPNDAGGTTDAMMVSHIRYRALQAGGEEPFTRPITLDPSAFGTLMRLPEFAAWRAGHLVMADSLGVLAVKKWYAQEGESDFPNRTVVRDALLAGNDLLPFTEFNHDPAKPGWHDYQLPVIQDSILYMRDQYASDPDFRRRVDDAVRHIVATKVKLYPDMQLGGALVDPAQAATVAGHDEERMEALAADALTLVEPTAVDELRTRLPRGPVTPDKLVIVECWDDCYPYRVMPKADLQDALLRLYGPAGKGRLRPEDVSTMSFGELDAWLVKQGDPAVAGTDRLLREASWIVFALTEYNPDGRPTSGAAKRFLDRTPLDVRNKTIVAISYNVPYHLDSTEIAKLSAYFVVYNKTRAAIDTGFRALFGDAVPKGRSPVNVSGAFYNVADQVQPDSEQAIMLSVYGRDGADLPDADSVPLVAGPVRDRNGNPVPDGTMVTFTLAKDGGATAKTTAATTDGVAAATLPASGRAAYTATANVGEVQSAALLIGVGQPAAGRPDGGANTGGGDGRMILWLAVAAGAVLVAAGGAGFALARGRRAGAQTAPALAAVTAGGAVVSAPVALARPLAPDGPRAVVVDAETRRVFVNGMEATPGLSSEQFRLLSYLYERAGKVVGREELVLHVWPGAHAEGVSEEALDALVRRVRERIIHAGGDRSYIVTLRGQGFRLDV